MKLADVIEKAINEYLSMNAIARGDTCEHSCDAVAAAQGWPEEDMEYEPSHAFLSELGCAVGSSFLFSDIERGPKRQMARALWLTWAAMIAREEGVEI